MSKQKKGAPAASSSRQFKLIHQSLSIGEINFKRKIIIGCTELTVLPITSTGKLWKLPLNCKQCRILRITVNGSHKANYSYADPALSICPQDTKKRNLEYYDSRHYDVVQSCDSDLSLSGELIVKIPKDAYDITGRNDGKPLRVMIEYSLEQPKGGVQFVVPTGDTPEAARHTHAYSFGWENSSRLWFPCVDSYTELCQWSLSFTVPANMTAVSSGDLVEQLLTSDGRKKIVHYSLSIPTAAPCIAFAVGCFEVYPDPVLQEITHFCLPGLLPVLKNTVQFVNQVLGFYEELLSARFPHSSFKLVFVDKPYQEAASYATLSILSTNLLHSHRIIDQVPDTRRLIALAVAKQYFGCYVLPSSWNDWWLPCGVSGFIASLFCKKLFGNTDYQHWIMQEQQRVCQFENDHTLPPLCGSMAALSLAPSLGGASSGSSSSSSSSSRGSLHPHLTSERELSVLSSKAHLVVRMIQLKIGYELTVQVFHKLLTLASAAAQTSECGQWHNLLISTGGFMKSIHTVSGKELTHFMEQWVCRSGVPRFHASFNYVRKRGIIELKLKQDLPRGFGKFVGSMNINVQEFDCHFVHSVQIEDSLTVHELPCHSKIRKSKKRKVPLAHGEEIDIDVSGLDMETPLLWLRVDPEFQWVRQLSVEQGEATWAAMLRHERDAVAQLEAIEALEKFPSSATRDVLRDIVFTTSFHYQVRSRAAEALAKLLMDFVGSPSFLISCFQKLFGSHSHLPIVRYNSFSDFSSYHLQKALVLAVGGMRGLHKQCPKEVHTFLTEVIKYTDNQLNKYSDGCYTSALIEALAKTVTPKVAVGTQAIGVDASRVSVSSLSSEVQYLLQEIVLRLNIEKVLPSYRYTVTGSCLAALRVLQRNGHVPTESSLFREYAVASNFIDIRIAALKAIVDIVQAEQNEAELSFLLDVVENDEPAIRLVVLQMLATSPPFTRRSESKLNTLGLVERLWTLICTRFSHDSRLRNAAVDVYAALYGRLTPTCVPQGLGIVIDLKEKKARSSLSSPSLTPTPTLLGNEELKTKVLSLTSPLASVELRKEGVLHTPSPVSVQVTPTSQPLPTQVPARASSSASLRPDNSQLDGSSTSKRSLTGSTISHLAQSPLAVTADASDHPPPPRLSLKIPTAHLKRHAPAAVFLGVPHEGLEGGSATPSPESVLSGTPSPYQPKQKRAKMDREHKSKKKHKHKEHRHKHRHKHGSRRDGTPQPLD